VAGRSPAEFCSAVLGVVLRCEAFEWTKACANEYCDVEIAASDPLASPLVALIFLFLSGILQRALVMLATEFNFVVPETVPVGLYSFAVTTIQRAVQGLPLKGSNFDCPSMVREVDTLLKHEDNKQLLEFLSNNYKIRRQGGEIVLLSLDDNSNSDNNAHRN
jgi:hypothetical protein